MNKINENKKGFVSTLIVFFSFLLLITLVVVISDYNLARDRELIQLSASKKVIYAYYDVEEDLEKMYGLNVSSNEENVSITDHLPGEGILENVTAYNKFIMQYYRTRDLDIFMRTDGIRIDFEDTDLALRVLPYGIVYSYDDLGKRELYITVPSENFSAISHIYMNLTTTANITGSPSASCSEWSPYQRCKHNTRCFYFTFVLIDVDGTVYQSECTEFDPDKMSQLKINLQNGGSGWVEVRVGDIPDLITIRMQNAGVDESALLELNSSDYTLNIADKLVVNDINSNISKEDYLGD
ncbi:MAG: hypothetical protein ABIH99_01860 [Candidatus Micrarchaeota archaeon]